MEQGCRPEASELSKNVCFTTQFYSQYQIYCLVTEAEESAMTLLNLVYRDWELNLWPPAT